jgi:peptidoglycan/xylan/chitin deacetylase (PgdA/CDA1 family)
MNRYVLTFDDSPGPATPKFLDLLRHHGMRATFFVVGRRAMENPETLGRIVDEGHSLGWHGWSHERPVPGFYETIMELAQADPILPHLDKLYRPPWGKLSYWGKVATLWSGWRPAHWDFSIADWVPRAPEAMIDDLMVNIYPNAVVLAHDHHEGGSVHPRTDRTWTLEALDRFFILTKHYLQACRWDEVYE